MPNVRSRHWFGSFSPAPYYTYYAHNADNNCEKSEELPAGAVVKFTIYKQKHAEQYREHEA